VATGTQRSRRTRPEESLVAWCYVTMLDGAGKSRGSFVIWPDNLFDNGALLDYAGPFVEDEGYLSHPLSGDPNLALSDDGRLKRV
jgi:hypothetical protein